MSMLKPTTANGRDALIETAAAAGSVGEVFATSSERLRRLVPYDAAVWLANDPSINLPTAPSRAENMEERVRSVGLDALERFWEMEFLASDFNSFSELTRARRPAADLHLATGGRPSRSARYREGLQAKGFSDELRMVMRVDGIPWASLNLFRERGRDPFESDEVDLVSRLSAPLGEAVRAQARPPLPAGSSAGGRGPGLMMFAPDGE